MSSFINLLNQISQELNIIGGITLLIFGLIDNSLTILIFSSVLNIKVFPATPGRLYLLTTAVADFTYVSYLLLTVVLISGFFIPVTNTSNFMCKSRFFIGQVCVYTSLSCTCFATIDQYVLSSRSVRVRQLSRLSLSKVIVSFSIILWCLINMCELFLYNVYPKPNSTSTVCTVYSPAWTFYFTYIQSLGLLCLLPLGIFIIFGILTRNNLRSVRQLHRSITRQMTRMILLQAMTMAISLFISTIQIIYQAITLNIEKDGLRTAQETLFNTIANLLTYVNYTTGFYIYFFSSKSLRTSLKTFLLNRRQENEATTIAAQLSRTKVAPTITYNKTAQSIKQAFE
jgi:hypothetical protein